MSDFFQEFRGQQKFGLDAFQTEACEAISAGKGVLVCAPTGSGKTLVGEYALALGLHRGLRSFYTTPIKALSNQKYYDLVALHGQDNVGLLTGDVSVNHDAPIVVMTTEVLRNMIYARSTGLDALGYVVMDEIHYLADRSRGAVWEEIILALDEAVQLVGLSATVSNAEEFGAWLSSVRGEFEVIVTDKRPVPLTPWMMVGKHMHRLLESPTSDAVNPALERSVARALDREVRSAGFRGEKSRKVRGRPFRPTTRPEVLHLLEDAEMLPAITFIFSRAGCEDAVYQCLRSSLVFTTQAEAEEIAEYIDANITEIAPADLQVLNFKAWRAALMRGFAAHHAGMLPTFRHIVEHLFARGLLRAIFATETLALGINMPARTVVLEKMVKFNGEAHVDLKPAEYTQLTGRAGRRGIDDHGNAVILWTPALEVPAVAGLATTRTYPLQSTFSPGYNMSINLLQTFGRDGAHRILEKSFAQFQANGDIVTAVRQVEQQQKTADEAFAAFQAMLSTIDIAASQAHDVIEYAKLRRACTQAEKLAAKKAQETQRDHIRAVLSNLQLGEVIALPAKKRPLLAVVLQPARDSNDPRPLVVSEKGWQGRLAISHFGVAPIVLGHMRLPRSVLAQPQRHGKQAATRLVKFNNKRPKSLRLRAKQKTPAHIKELRAAVRAHELHHWPDIAAAMPLADRYLRAQEDVDRKRAAIAERTDTLSATFDRILELLREMDYVSGNEITEEGRRLARIHHQNDLLIAQCLKRQIWKDLDPAELAGVVSMCSFENRRELNDGQPEAATEPMAQAMRNTHRLWLELQSDERRHDLDVSKPPEDTFALAMHQWTAGAPLEYCLAAAHEAGADLSPGDFVRACRQVIDVLNQVKVTAYDDQTRENARQAVTAINRGVIAAAAM
ncbi:MAG: DEAD/DEAH box helicase [Corynebacterium sp.]|nr:DEAD/DEAH box helicase [Corynebacterium sp.]